jgi:hypothetical protein
MPGDRAPELIDDRERSAAEFPIELGARRVAGQLASFLPQANLTLLSVLQAVVLGILLTRTDSVRVFSLPALPQYLASLALIALVWHEYLWAFISYAWPLSSRHTLLHFALAAAEGTAFASIGNTPH